MGKSFAQLLTSRAVLIAVGLAVEGGGSGWMACRGPVGVRRRGCGPESGWWFSEFMGGDRQPPFALDEGSLARPLGGLTDVLECWLCEFVGQDWKTGVVGLEGWGS